MCQGRGLNESAIENADTMVDFILLANTTKDADGLWNAGLAHKDLCEPTFERGILLDVLAVFREGRRTDTAKLATSKQRLQQICGVHAPTFGAATGHDEVQLVNEEDDAGALFRGFLDFVEDGLDTFFVFALVLGASHESTHVQRVQASEEGSRDVAVDDTLGKPFRDGGLADTGLTNENGVVLCPANSHSQ